MTLLLDSREGSWQLALLEPLRSLLPLCPVCLGANPHCEACRQYTDRRNNKYVAVGRQLSRLATSRGEGGPDVLIIGQGPTGPVTVAVEVKALRDLIQAADTGRLQAPGDGQLPAMLADYDQSWLLWYGNVRCGDAGYLEEPGGRGDNGRCLWRPFTKNGSVAAREEAAAKGRGLPCSYLDGLLLAVARMGVHVHRAANERDAARWLGVLYESWTKPYDEHKFTRVFRDVTRFPQQIPGVTPKELERAKRVADRYPGLGVERALAAAKHFESVRAMANASEEEWRKVPGVGKVIAAAVVKGFRA